jgi:hypothetical protein
VLTYGQLFVMGGASNGAVDVGKMATTFGIPSPYFRRGIRHWRLHEFKLIYLNHGVKITISE